MQLLDVTSLILVVLAIFIGAMAWGIREALETSIEYQEEILAELVYSKLRPVQTAELVESNSRSAEVEVLVPQAHQA
jgi:hypothetical protein